MKFISVLSIFLLGCGRALGQLSEDDDFPVKEIVTGQIYSDPIQPEFLVMWLIGPPMALAASLYMLIVHIPRCLKASKTVRNIPVADNATLATVRILQCIPVFGITSSLALFWPEITDVTECIQSVSIAIGFVNYCQLLIWLLGGAENAIEIWSNVPPSKLWATMPLCFIAPCVRKSSLGVRELKQIRFWSYQYVIAGPFIAFLDVAVADRIRDEYLGGIQTVLLVCTVISTMGCMYHVNIIRDVCAQVKELEPYKVIGKFTVIKALILLCKILGLFFAAFFDSKELDNGNAISGQAHGQMWSNFVSCVVTGVLGIMAVRQYPVEDCESNAMKEDTQDEKRVTFAEAREDVRLISHMSSANATGAIDLLSQYDMGQYTKMEQGKFATKMPLLKRLQTQ